MEVFMITREEYNEIIKRLDTLNEHVKKLTTPSHQKFLDNEEFLTLMKISKRTAQVWRDEGKISFSQIGNKIYYLLSDVEILIKEHYWKAHKYKKR
ncbi:MAG: helix-turn-helix domain-containing protein [Bacteroidia bacterium]